MVKKMCIAIMLSFAFFLAISRVDSNSNKAEKSLEGQWTGTLCTGMPVESNVRMMKYTCDWMDIQFDQTGNHVTGRGLLSQALPLFLKGITQDNFFYGTNAGEDPADAGGGTFVVARGFLYGNTMQMTIDVYELQNNIKVWVFGGITTLYKQEKK